MRGFRASTQDSDLGAVAAAKQARGEDAEQVETMAMVQP
jgi:hypothetical protein